MATPTQASAHRPLASVPTMNRSAATAGGGPVTTAVLRVADPSGVGVRGGPSDPQVLRGGAWIGTLERAAVAATLLAGFGEGLAVVLAVSAACVGVAVLLRS